MRTARQHHREAGFIRVPTVIEARKLRREGKPWRVIYEMLGVTSQILKMVARVAHIERDEDITAEDLADQTFKNGRSPAMQLSEQEVAAVKRELLETNRNADSGSLPEALRRMLKRGEFRPEVGDFIQSRFNEGMPLPEALRNQVFIPESITRTDRAPRNEWLNEVQSPGSLFMTWNDDGTARLKQPGEEMTIDDGTMNFPCCVEIERPGDPCWERFGVCVGRWQFLLAGDTRTYAIPGFSHTARPRSSYRAEDLLATWQTVFAQHGVPPTIIMEQGISKANLIAEAMRKLGVKLTYAKSPHQKVVEGIFNNLWTRLSGMPGQVGRFRGEEEEVNKLLESCRRGHTDPRTHFPKLLDVLKALHAAIAEWNSHLLQSDQYGSWIPGQFFQRAKVLRPLNPADAWMFSPVVTDPLLLRRQDVTTSYQVMPGWSMVFNFSAPWFHEYHGARIRLHYNPHIPECDAMVVLAEDFHGERSGTVLGPAVQINWHTRHSRRLLGIDEQEDVGLVQTRMNAAALRRSVIGIKMDGTIGAQVHERRNGIGNVEIVNTKPARQEQPGEAVADPLPSRSSTPAVSPRVAVAVERHARKRALQNQADDALANLID
jgi:hypothetical protein